MDQEARQAPLTPFDCDLRDFPFMPVDIARLFNSEFHARATDSEWRAAVTLWLKSYHQVPAGSIPDDDIALARLAEFGRDVKAWKKVRAVALHGWIRCSDGRLYHSVVAEKATEAWERKKAFRDRTEKARQARLQQRQSQKPTDSVTEHSTGSVTESTGTGTGTEDRDKLNTGTYGTSSSSAAEDLVGAVDNPPAEPPDCPHLDILALWREVLPAMPQHDPKKWHKTRREHLQTRWRETAAEKGWSSKEQGLAYFRKLFAYVGQSRFLTGRTQSRDPHKPPFVIELEWLILPSNWAKVHEGKYHAED